MINSLLAAAWSHITDLTKFLRTCLLDAIDAYMYTISFYLNAARTYLSPISAYLPDPTDLINIVPTTLTVFVITSVHIQHMRFKTVSLLETSQDTSAVSGRYGPGSYYAWLFNAVVACQSEPTSAQAQPYAVVASLGVNVYAIAAAIDQLDRTLNTSLYSQPILDASDRVNMVGWIIATIYLLRQSSIPRPTESSIQLHILQTGTWMITWLLHTIAMVVYSIHRGDLGARILMCGVPFAFSVLLPLLVMTFFQRTNQLQVNPRWATTTLYTGTTFLSMTYVLTPRRYRYDPDSPTAPLAHAKMSDIDQVTTLIAGLMFVVPHLLSMWDEGRIWLTDRVRVELSALSCAFDACMSKSWIYLLQVASSVFDWLHALWEMVVACIVSFQANLNATFRKNEDVPADNM